ncbi:hypothetical protein B0H13DRAFT_2276851 [Mycena leptocephala]|nr:hypothetical protein B0H13DRAFT_2276851 [Mycena leptocephala]
MARGMFPRDVRARQCREAVIQWRKVVNKEKKKKAGTSAEPSKRCATTTGRWACTRREDPCGLQAHVVLMDRRNNSTVLARIRHTFSPRASSIPFYSPRSLAATTYYQRSSSPPLTIGAFHSYRCRYLVLSSDPALTSSACKWPLDEVLKRAASPTERGDSGASTRSLAPSKRLNWRSGSENDTYFPRTARCARLGGIGPEVMEVGSGSDKISARGRAAVVGPRFPGASQHGIVPEEMMLGVGLDPGTSPNHVPQLLSRGFSQPALALAGVKCGARSYSLHFSRASPPSPLPGLALLAPALLHFLPSLLSVIILLTHLLVVSRTPFSRAARWTPNKRPSFPFFGCIGILMHRLGCAAAGTVRTLGGHIVLLVYRRAARRRRYLGACAARIPVVETHIGALPLKGDVCVRRGAWPGGAGGATSSAGRCRPVRVVDVQSRTLRGEEAYYQRASWRPRWVHACVYVPDFPRWRAFEAAARGVRCGGVLRGGVTCDEDDSGREDTSAWRFQQVQAVQSTHVRVDVCAEGASKPVCLVLHLSAEIQEQWRSATWGEMQINATLVWVAMGTLGCDVKGEGVDNVGEGTTPLLTHPLTPEVEGGYALNASFYPGRLALLQIWSVFDHMVKRHGLGVYAYTRCLLDLR